MSVSRLSFSFVASLLIHLLTGLNPGFSLAAEPVVKFGAWEYLYGGPVKSLAKSPLKTLDQFRITGAEAKHPFLLNEVVCDGRWQTSKGALQQADGRSAALLLGEANSFELEAGVNAEGEGGWFLLFGLTEGHGYGVYNVTLRESGSPWHLSEFRNYEGVEATDREIARYACRGNEALYVRVVDGKLSVKINRRVLIEDEPLPNYEGGEVILGTYDTNYGPKPLKIYGLRLRRPMAAE